MYFIRKLPLFALIVICLANTAFAVEEREGFYKSLNVDSGTYPILTVPSGKTFVLLQINASNPQFNIPP